MDNQLQCLLMSIMVVRYVQINDAFRAYPSNYESIVDHGRFLKEKQSLQ